MSTNRRTLAGRATRLIGVAAVLSMTLQGGAVAQTAAPRSAPYRSLTSTPLPPAGFGPSGQIVRVDVGSNGRPTPLELPKGKSATIELPVDARDVLVTDPKVADLILQTPRRVVVLGVGSGQTDAVIFDSSGRQILNLNIRVDQDVGALAQTLNRILGNSSIRIEALNSSLILTGQVQNASEADKAVRLAASMVEKPEQVLNMLSIAGQDQVMLKVRIVEVDRSSTKQLGINLNAVMNQVGEPQYSIGKAITYGVTGSLLGGLTAGVKQDTTQGPVMTRPCGYPAPNDTAVCEYIVRAGGNSDTATVKTNLAGDPGLNKAEAMVQAFERVGLIRTLAETSLAAVSGESASFQSGGEFPVPVGQDSTGKVTIEFKPFGVGLGFTPVVLSEGRISLKISTEYSELTNVGSFTLNTTPTAGGATTPGLTIPGLAVRKAQTMVELPSGGSMMIAGLLSTTTKQTLDSLPGLMELPVLGALFRSRDFQNNESELVVIVTPYIVQPGRPDQMQTPADGLQIATDLETTLLGRLNRASGRKTPAAAKTYQGPFGYVVD